MVEVPKDAIRIDKKLVAYTHEYSGKKYVNIKKTYTDETGKEGIGTGGLTINFDQFKLLEGCMPEISKRVEAEK